MIKERPGDIDHHSENNSMGKSMPDNLVDAEGDPDDTCLLCMEHCSQANPCAELPCCNVNICKRCVVTWLQTSVSRGVALTCPSGTCGRLPIDSIEVPIKKSPEAGIYMILYFSTKFLKAANIRHLESKRPWPSNSTLESWIVYRMNHCILG